MIATERDLAAFLPKVQDAEWVAIDTEADSLHAYPEKLCLFQVSVAGSDELIDPLAGYDLTPLLEAIRSKPLLLHGADYDLRLLYRTYRFVPDFIFDTMWAARLLGYREFSLSALVQHHLGVALEKGPQKMNWGLRPLPDRMAAYASNDTRYLRPISEILRTRLSEQGRSAWQAEVCQRVIAEGSRSRNHDPDSLWRIRGSDRLDPPAMAVLRELWRWREEEALAANKPPYFIFSHERMVALSAAAPRGQLSQALIPPHFPSRRAARLLAAVERGLEVPPSDYPQPLRNHATRLTRDQQAHFDELRSIRDSKALELGLDPTVLSSKAELMIVAQRASQHNGELMSWQRQLLGLHQPVGAVEKGAARTHQRAGCSGKP